METLLPLPRTGSRQHWMDVARALGITLVVYGHVLDGLRNAGVVPAGIAAAWTSYTLYTFHMPLFFFLAGLNVERSLMRGTRSFLAAKARSLAYPYLLWSLIQGGIAIALSRYVNSPLHPGDLASIWYRPIGQFWFLYALLICHVLAALAPSRAALSAGAAVGLSVFLALPVRPDLALTLHHLPFYVAGIYGARLVLAWQPAGPRGWGGLLACWLAFAVAALLGGRASGMDALAAASLPAGILGVAGTVLLAKLLGGAAAGWLAAVGGMSMSIYVMHILAGSGFRVALNALHVPLPPWAHLALGTAAGMALPMLAHAVLRAMRLLGPLGLAVAPPRAGRPALPQPSLDPLPDPRPQR